MQFQATKDVVISMGDGTGNSVEITGKDCVCNKINIESPRYEPDYVSLIGDSFVNLTGVCSPAKITMELIVAPHNFILDFGIIKYSHKQSERRELRIVQYRNCCLQLDIK